jgi:hypothetical protein
MSKLKTIEARKAHKALYDALRCASFIGSQHGFEAYADRINDIADEVRKESRAEAALELDSRLPAK